MAIQTLSVSAGGIPSDVVAAWRGLTARNPCWRSAFFDPEFTRVIAAVRSDVELAVSRDGPTINGVLPYMRCGGSRGRAIGGALCDFQGPIFDGHSRWSAEELIAACGMGQWRFTHLMDPCRVFRDHYFRKEISPFADLELGYEAYRCAMTVLGHHALNKSWQAARRIERELGPIEYLASDDDPRSLEMMIAWKSDQYRRTHVPDIFQFPWIREVLLALPRGDGPLQARMSTLKAGGRTIAVHFGLVANGVLHYWFPAHDPNHPKLSPGRVLLAHLLRGAAEHGISRIDFGKGRTQFKCGFMNGAHEVHEGCVELNSVTRALRHGWWRARSMVASSALHAPAKRAYEWLARDYLRSQYR